jgi:hypothetical protein
MGPWYTDIMMRRDTMDIEQMIEYVRQTWFEDVMQDRDRIMEIVANVLDEELSQLSEEEIMEEYTFLTGLGD